MYATSYHERARFLIEQYDRYRIGVRVCERGPNLPACVSGHRPSQSICPSTHYPKGFARVTVVAGPKPGPMHARIPHESAGRTTDAGVFYRLARKCLKPSTTKPKSISRVVHCALHMCMLDSRTFLRLFTLPPVGVYSESPSSSSRYRRARDEHPPDDVRRQFSIVPIFIDSRKRFPLAYLISYV